MPTKPMNQKDRVRRAVTIDERGCWIWGLQKDRVGYGRLTVNMGSRKNYRSESAHRYAYELWIGVIPDGMCVLHRCDNRACCNPDHLFIGTQKDNIHDMHAKERGPRGYKRDPAVCASNARGRNGN